MSCNICFSDTPLNPISTPCNHIFCYECIKKWIYKKPNCPCCRRDFSVEEVLEYYCKYSDKIVTRSKTLLLRKEIVMNNAYKNLRSMMQEQDEKKRREKACDTFKYVYEHKEAFNKLADKAIFLKTVYKKALQFYKDDGFPVFYEWVFKFRNYIALIDKNFLYYNINIIRI